MLDMIKEMATDRLWIYTGIAGSIFGAAFLAYFKDTRAGLWCYEKFDEAMDYLIHHLGWSWLQPPSNVWRKRYPHITKKIDDLEKRVKELEGK
jgi:hypothetical protein